MRQVYRIIIVSETGDLCEHNGDIFKVCTGPCNEMKAISEFGFRQMKPNDPDTLYVQPQCRTCRSLT